MFVDLATVQQPNGIKLSCMVHTLNTSSFIYSNSKSGCKKETVIPIYGKGNQKDPRLMHQDEQEFEERPSGQRTDPPQPPQNSGFFPNWNRGGGGGQNNGVQFQFGLFPFFFPFGGGLQFVSLLYVITSI